MRRNPLTTLGRLRDTAGTAAIGLASLGVTVAVWLVASPIGTGIGSSPPSARPRG